MFYTLTNLLADSWYYMLRWALAFAGVYAFVILAARAKTTLAALIRVSQ